MSAPHVTPRTAAPRSDAGAIRSTRTATPSTAAAIAAGSQARPATACRRSRTDGTRGGAEVTLGRSASLQGNDGGKRQRHDLDIEPQRPAVDVFEVTFDPAVEVRIVARADLP